MGCVSSKPLKKNLKHKVLLVNAAELSNHVVSLTSSTYGALKLDRDAIFLPSIVGKTSNLPEVKETHQGEVIKKNKQVAVVVPKVEVINTWELMSDLEDEIREVPMSSDSSKKEGRSPFKRVSSMMSNNLINSPKGGVGKLDGKENKGGPQINYATPKGRVFKPWKFSTGSNDKERKLGSSSPRRSNSGSRRRRRSLGPLFDPELIDSFEKELSMEEEQIKKMVSPKAVDKECSVLDKYQKLCPPGGEHCVVIYTTTLRGIRKTFEDCNVVRAAIESYQIRVIERDISMDSGFKEELRKLMGRKDVKVPAVFVKGRLIGGANEVVKLDEEGRLEGLLAGISKAVLGCQGCGGIRFVMCSECNGSCKVLDQRQKCMVRCGECNENGLIHCPLCSSSLIT